jgi:hypothetical protein
MWAERFPTNTNTGIIEPFQCEPAALPKDCGDHLLGGKF